MAKRNAHFSDGPDSSNLQMKLNMSALQTRRFTIDLAVKTKLDLLSSRIERIEYPDLTWLCRLESFLQTYGYLTERQFQTLDGICSRYNS